MVEKLIIVIMDEMISSFVDICDGWWVVVLCFLGSILYFIVLWMCLKFWVVFKVVDSCYCELRNVLWCFVVLDMRIDVNDYDVLCDYLLC